MMNQPTNWHSNHTIQGILLLIAGVLLFLYTLNILTTGITIVLIIASIALIAYGAMVSGLDKIIMNLIHKFRK